MTPTQTNVFISFRLQTSLSLSLSQLTISDTPSISSSPQQIPISRLLSLTLSSLLRITIQFSVTSDLLHPSHHLQGPFHSATLLPFTPTNLFKTSSSQLITNPPTALPELIDSYNSTLRSLLDKHTPLITRPVPALPSKPMVHPCSACHQNFQT
jgi:hypothetical protein